MTILRRGFLSGLGTAAFLGTGKVRAASAPASVVPTLSAAVTRVSFPNFWRTNQAPAAMLTRFAHAVPFGAEGPRLVWGNLGRTGAAFEAPGPNPIEVSAALELPDGTIVPVTFQGRPRTVIAGGATVTSDPVPVTLAPGSICFSRTAVAATAPPYHWPMNQVINAGVGDWFHLGDTQVNPGDTPAQLGHGGVGFGPLNVVARLVRPGPSVAILGDSVVEGEPGSGDPHGDRGYLERALGTHVPWCNFATGGDGAAAFLQHGQQRLALIQGHFTHAISALGITEVRNGDEAAAKAALTRLWQMLAAHGLIVFQTTITTHTKSTDGWRTASGQTVANPAFLPNGLHARLNAWIRTTPPPLAGTFDVTADLETGRDSGLWISPDGAPVTADGPHLNALGAQLAARGIDVSKLVLQVR